jgi:ABC-type bacteriocin/lantibiotic exporter with double-glycine peptidase domain
MLLGAPTVTRASVMTPGGTPSIPFYSQFKDISSTKWQKVGCGIASLAMVIDYYKPAVPVNTLLGEAVALGAYSDAGWTYAGLISASKKYGMVGTSYDLATSNMDTAFSQLSTKVSAGPVIASVHYKFQPTNPIPHLVVISSIHNGLVYYNDPAALSGGTSISVSDFKKAWKKRYIVIRPNPVSNTVAIVTT